MDVINNLNSKIIKAKKNMVLFYTKWFGFLVPSLQSHLKLVTNKCIVFRENIYTIFDKLSNNNRYALFLVGGFVVLCIWKVGVHNTMNRTLMNLTSKVNSIERTVLFLRKEKERLILFKEKDPNAPVLAEIENLKIKTAAWKEKVEMLTKDQKSPSTLAKLIKKQLIAKDAYVLSGMSTLQVHSIGASNKDRASKIIYDSITIHAHPVEVVFTSDYLNTLEMMNYMQDIGKFYWDNLVYEVKSYPKAIITVEFHVRGKDEYWSE